MITMEIKFGELNELEEYVIMVSSFFLLANGLREEFIALLRIVVLLIIGQAD